MKPEPLKDKQLELTGEGFRIIGGGGIINTPHSAFSKEDIKSAVEWMKEQYKTDDNIPAYVYRRTLKWIDKAFQDVIKK